MLLLTPHSRVRSTVKRLFSHLSRFAAVAALSFALNVSTTVVLHELLGVAEEVSFALALVGVFAINFLLTRYWVFPGQTRSVRRQLLQTLAVSVTFRVGEYSAFLLAHTVLGVHYVAATVGVLVVSFGLKFFVYRQFVFTRSPR